MSSFNIFALMHQLALIHANAFVGRYFFGYDDADSEIWGMGYAAVWERAA